MLTDPCPDIVEPAPEPVSPELDEFELRIPRVDTPRIDVPTVHVPTHGRSGTTGGGTSALHDGLVLYYGILAHVVVLLWSLGGLFLAGRGQWMIGGKLLAAGVIIAIYTIYRYHHPPRLPR